MIQLKQINKFYRTGEHEPLHVLHNINLHIKEGEIFGIIGKTGAGKSTLARCVNLIERPESGQIFIDKTELTQLSKRKLRHARRQIGMIFQHFNLLTSRTVYDNIALPLELIGTTSSAKKNKINELLALTGLSERKNYYPSQLSGGQKQRVAIARALVNQPKVLLCDEATSALDPDTTRSILNLIQDVNRQLGLTTLLITHEMDVIKRICQRLAVMEDGKIVEEAETLDFFTRPTSTAGKHFRFENFKANLPMNIRQRLTTEATATAQPLVLISFKGEITAEPIISTVIQTFNVHVSILSAHVEQICDVTVGMLIVHIQAELAVAKQCLDYIQQKNISAEILAYV